MDAQGWWRTGDLATLGDAEVAPDLAVAAMAAIRWRTVFPEQLEIVCWDWRLRLVCPLGR